MQYWCRCCLLDIGGIYRCVGGAVLVHVLFTWQVVGTLVLVVLSSVSWSLYCLSTYQSFTEHVVPLQYCHCVICRRSSDSLSSASIYCFDRKSEHSASAVALPVCHVWRRATGSRRDSEGRIRRTTSTLDSGVVRPRVTDASRLIHPIYHRLPRPPRCRRRCRLGRRSPGRLHSTKRCPAAGQGRRKFDRRTNIQAMLRRLEVPLNQTEMDSNRTIISRWSTPASDVIVYSSAIRGLSVTHVRWTRWSWGLTRVVSGKESAIKKWLHSSH